MQDRVDLIFGRGMSPRRLLPSRAGPETRPRKSNHGTRDGCDPGTGGSLHAFVHSSRKDQHNVCNAYPWPLLASYGATFCRRARPVNGASCRMRGISAEHLQADVDKIDMTCGLYTHVPFAMPDLRRCTHRHSERRIEPPIIHHHPALIPRAHLPAHLPLHPALPPS